MAIQKRRMTLAWHLIKRFSKKPSNFFFNFSAQIFVKVLKNLHIRIVRCPSVCPSVCPWQAAVCLGEQVELPNLEHMTLGTFSRGTFDPSLKFSKLDFWRILYCIRRNGASTVAWLRETNMQIRCVMLRVFPEDAIGCLVAADVPVADLILHYKISWQ